MAEGLDRDMVERESKHQPGFESLCNNQQVPETYQRVNLHVGTAKNVLVIFRELKTSVLEEPLTREFHDQLFLRAGQDQ